MSDDLRTRIAAVVYRHTLFRALDQCECGAAFDGFSGRSLDAYAAHVADAVIRELSPQLTAWARACVSEGDMTPAAERQLHNILGEYDSDG